MIEALGRAQVSVLTKRLGVSVPRRRAECAEAN